MISPVSIPKKTISSKSYDDFLNPLRTILPDAPELISRGDRPLQLTFEYQLKALIHYHLWEHESARALIQNLKEDNFAREHIAPPGGIGRSSFGEVLNARGVDQLQYVFQELCSLSRGVIPRQYAGLGDIVAVDGSLIDAVLSMYWADYRKGSRKAKGHFGFDPAHGIPDTMNLSENSLYLISIC